MPDADGERPFDDADDPGAGRSRWVALALVALIVAWMASGLLLPAGDGEVEAPGESGSAESVAVAVRESTAESVTRTLRAEGQARPDRETAVTAEATGEIAELPVRRGQEVAVGALIARIAPGRREAELARAEADLARARRDFDNAEALLDRGAGTVDRLAETRAALAAAEARLAAAREAIDDLDIRAPFAGRVEELEIELGEVVRAGATVARIVDLSPLSVRIRLPQTAVGAVQEGQPAEVTFIGGTVRQGTVVFVGARADEATRTFEAEVEVPNDEATIPAGISASVRLPVGEEAGHFVSPAVLSLDAAGRLGVKTVDDESIVHFHEIEIVRAQSDGVWVSGLPERARIVTVGQGYVGEGEHVIVRDEAALGLGRARESTASPQVTE
ncbi:MAG: efflux RND transporter periplasmic adaptor subunit [Paracoccaceae bacterium]|jgi:multidrug efflux system membrane fusion protein|nr:efflux RND transporter periplasmic adaptor subunit [Paracoccaceae bacterium]